MYQLFFQIFGSAKARYPYVILMIVGLCGVIASLYFVAQNNATKHWPVAPAMCISGPRVPSKDGRTSARMVDYQYSVSGKNYTTQIFQPAIRNDVDPTVQVHYDPLNPSHGVVISDNTAILVMCFIFSAVITFYSFFNFVGGQTIDTRSYSTWRY